MRRPYVPFALALAVALPTAGCGIADAINSAVEAAQQEVDSAALDELNANNDQGTEEAFARTFAPVFEAVGNSIQTAMESGEPAASPGYVPEQGSETITIEIDEAAPAPGGGNVNTKGSITVTNDQGLVTVVMDIDVVWSGIPVRVGELSYTSKGNAQLDGNIEFDSNSEEGTASGSMNLAGEWALDDEEVAFSITAELNADGDYVISGTINGEDVEFDTDQFEREVADGSDDGEATTAPTFGTGACGDDLSEGAGDAVCFDVDGTATDLSVETVLVIGGSVTIDAGTEPSLQMNVPDSLGTGSFDCSDQAARISLDGDGKTYLSFLAASGGFCEIRFSEFGTDPGAPIAGTFTAVLFNGTDASDKLVVRGALDVTVPEN